MVFYWKNRLCTEQKSKESLKSKRELQLSRKQKSKRELLFARSHTRDQIQQGLEQQWLQLSLWSFSIFKNATISLYPQPLHHTIGQGSKSMMNASQTNSSAQIKDLWPSLVTTQSQKFERLCFIKHMQHHNGSTNDPFSPSHLYKQQQLAKKKPLSIRLSHVKTIKLLSNQRMIPFLGTFQFCFVCWFYLSISKTLFGALTHQILFQGKELVVAP